MANMIYCRFQNTLVDLQDCAENLEDLSDNEEEEKAAKRMIKLMIEMLEGIGYTVKRDQNQNILR